MNEFEEMCGKVVEESFFSDFMSRRAAKKAVAAERESKEFPTYSRAVVDNILSNYNVKVNRHVNKLKKHYESEVKSFVNDVQKLTKSTAGDIKNQLDKASKKKYDLGKYTDVYTRLNTGVDDLLDNFIDTLKHEFTYYFNDLLPQIIESAKTGEPVEEKEPKKEEAPKYKPTELGKEDLPPFDDEKEEEKKEAQPSATPPATPPVAPPTPSPATPSEKDKNIKALASYKVGQKIKYKNRIYEIFKLDDQNGKISMGPVGGKANVIINASKLNPSEIQS
jgi:hypothetical protein